MTYRVFLHTNVPEDHPPNQQVIGLYLLGSYCSVGIVKVNTINNLLNKRLGI